MPLYIYEATDPEGVMARGEYDALNPQAVIEYLARKNLLPLKVQDKAAVRGKGGLRKALFESVTPLDRIIVVRNLAATLKAGLGIIQALDILITDTKKGVLRAILTKAETNLENGQPLSVTFASYRKIFPPVFVGMMKAGEASGRLAETLEELNGHLTREYNLTKKVKSALSYPIVLMVGSAGVVLLLLIVVLPRLANSFRQSGAELPLITKILVGLSALLTKSYTADVVILAGIIWFFLFFRKTRRGERFFSMVLMHTPVAKDLVKKVALVRFTRTLGSLIGSGTPIIDALQLSGESVGNVFYKKAIVESMDQVAKGVPFSSTLQKYEDLFPRFLTSLIVVGEKTGTVEHILKTFADFYDDEVENTLKDLTTLIEPILLIVMGLIIGTIALSVLLPIYQLVGKFS